jgi:DNA mismatch repair protein MutS
MMKAAAEYSTPMMRQYMRLREENPGTLLLFRCGDFYETYGDDAEEAGRILNIVVTRKGIGADGETMMAGVPAHAIDAYLAKLVRSGRRIAIAEQMEDPKAAKGLVKRDVVRIVTPGTALDESMVDERANNYLVALSMTGGVWGIALADLGTGYFAMTEAQGADLDGDLLTELFRLEPREILVPEAFDPAPLRPLLAERQVALTRRPADDFREETARRMLTNHFRVHSLDGFGIESTTAGVVAAGALLSYLRETQKTALGHITTLRVRHRRETMLLDAVTQRSLELVRGLHTGSRDATLLSVLDHTETPMGARLLRSWLLEPLRRLDTIEARHSAVERIAASRPLREGLAQLLKGVRDLERIVARVSLGSAGPRDLGALRAGLSRLPDLRALCLRETDSGLLAGAGGRLDPLPGLHESLSRALVEDPPLYARDGGIFRDAWSEELDRLSKLARSAHDWIAAFRQSEAERTGINGLKIGFNKVFGYYIELTKAQLRTLPNGEAPADYVRRQTVANAERFITEALKAKEDEVLHAEERRVALEQELFTKLREAVAEHTPGILANAAAIAELDCLLSLAQAAVRGGYVRPVMTEEDRLEIAEGRHPVLEALQREPPFVPNDTALNGDARIGLITGPNMAGKSTYIRQVALIVLMAHVGSFVPARRALIPLRDRIFTRVGAMDHLARGQSTFLVEMTELANILRHTTDSSLVILDEIGRGTSTYDGLSIAWATCESLHNAKDRRPFALFATHYHELTELGASLPALRNFHVAVKEDSERIVFLYRILPGATDRSYGIHAAELAGVPAAVVARAKEILDGLEDGRAVSPRVASDSHGTAARPKVRSKAAILPTPEPWEEAQLSLFSAARHPAVERLDTLDPNRLTPIEALSLLVELKRLSEK